MDNHIRVAKFVFSLDAVLGILAVGGAALYGAALTSGNAWTAFVAIFVPFAVLWTFFCYWAYKGLTSEKVVLKFVFWNSLIDVGRAVQKLHIDRSVFCIVADGRDVR